MSTAASNASEERNRLGEVCGLLRFSFASVIATTESTPAANSHEQSDTDDYLSRGYLWSSRVDTAMDASNRSTIAVAVGLAIGAWLTAAPSAGLASRLGTAAIAGLAGFVGALLLKGWH